MFEHQYLPRGQHLLADLTGVAADRLNDPGAMEQLLRRAAAAAGATVLSSNFHHFGHREGVTGVVLLAESHISIHTWPESGFAALDIFMCGSTHPEAALRVIQSGLQAKHCDEHIVVRGAETTTQ
jgi:S-adenosylmethionine decarboxylase